MVLISNNLNICYPFDLCYSKCRFSTDRIKQGDLIYNVYYLQSELLPLQNYTLVGSLEENPKAVKLLDNRLLMNKISLIVLYDAE